MNDVAEKALMAELEAAREDSKELSKLLNWPASDCAGFYTLILRNTDEMWGAYPTYTLALKAGEIASRIGLGPSSVDCKQPWDILSNDPSGLNFANDPYEFGP